MSQQQPPPFKLLWQNWYPFGYWYNRLEKINPYNEFDKLESLWSLTHLSDVYVHIFAANAQNPELPWFFLKENAFRGDIDHVLDALREDGMATVGTLSEDPDGLASFNTAEGYEIHDLDAIAGAFLGCPYTIDEENKSVEFTEDPDLHRGVCNAILDYAERHKPLLNDFKHGFRILPVTPDDVEQFIGESVIINEDDQEAFDERINDLRGDLQDDAWGFCFLRMHTEATEYGHDVQLDLYHVDAWACYKFAQLVLDALYNLVAPENPNRLEESIEEIPISVVKGEETIMDHVFGIATPLRDDPETVITKEEFNS